MTARTAYLLWTFGLTFLMVGGPAYLAAATTGGWEGVQAIAGGIVTGLVGAATAVSKLLEPPPAA